MSVVGNPQGDCAKEMEQGCKWGKDQVWKNHQKKGGEEREGEGERGEAKEKETIQESGGRGVNIYI